MKLTNYIPAILVFFMILGILVGYYFAIKPIILGLSLFGLLLALLFSYFITNHSFKQNYHFNILSYLLFFTIGIASITFQNIITK